MFKTQYFFDFLSSFHNIVNYDIRKILCIFMKNVEKCYDLHNLLHSEFLKDLFLIS